MNTTFIKVSYALIGTAVAASFFYTKKLEMDARRMTEQMQQDARDLQEAIRNLGK